MDWSTRGHINLTDANHRWNDGRTVNVATVDLAARPQPASRNSLVEERKGHPAAPPDHIETVLLMRDRPPGALRAREQAFGRSKAGGHLVIRGCMTSSDARA